MAMAQNFQFPKHLTLKHRSTRNAGPPTPRQRRTL